MKEEGQIIKEFLGFRTIAVAGVSREKSKFGRVVYEELKKKGYNVLAVSPNLGAEGYKDFYSLPEKPQGIIMVTKPEVSLKLTRDCAEAGINYIWYQQGASSEECIRLCKESGINYVAGRCIMMFAEPVESIHKFHRFLSKIFGKYPKVKE